jgi:hypothetical protein
MVYWSNSYIIVHFSLYIVEWYTQSIFRNVGLSGFSLATHRPYTCFDNSSAIYFSPHAFFSVCQCSSQLLYVFICPGMFTSAYIHLFWFLYVSKIALGIFMHHGLLKLPPQTFSFTIGSQIIPLR